MPDTGAMAFILLASMHKRNHAPDVTIAAYRDETLPPFAKIA